MMTRTPLSSGSAAICRVASSPSVPGIRMSISTTSACSERARSTAAAPSAASPTTSMDVIVGVAVIPAMAHTAQAR
jgi:hypothetical protein